jgi:uncharacterized delta-60 repeat protein
MKLYVQVPYLLLVLIISILLSARFGLAAAGDVDSSFKGYLAKLGGGRCIGSVIQPDGKIIVSGTDTMVNGLFKNTLFRLNTDGSLDASFNSSITDTSVASGSGISLAIQSNGKILVGGVGLARLNSDGSPDTAFNLNSTISNVATVFDLKVLANDKIVFAGVKSGSGANVITRLNADGSLDAETTFASLVFRLGVAPDGKIVFVNGAFSPVRRLNQDLTPDNTFTQVNINHTVYAIVVQPDGKTLIQGIITQINGTNSPNLVRVNTDGTVDSAFVGNAAIGGNNIFSLKLLSNGKILSGLIMRNVDGTLDSSFAATSFQTIWDLEVQNDGKFIAVGELPTQSTTAQSLVLRYNSNGSVDSSFLAAVGSFSYGTKVIVQPDDKILVNGNLNYSGGIVCRTLTRLNANGTQDTSFNTSEDYNLFDLLPNGKMMVSNVNSVRRLNSDGSYDFTFQNVLIGTNNIKALNDGRVLVARANSLERYTADGTLDSSFNVPVNSTIYKVGLQADGKILIGGNFTQVNGTDRSKIARLNSDGTLDSSFNSPNGGINGAILKFVITSGGKLVISGSFSGISFNTREGLARLNTDGSLDTSFVPPQSFSIDDIAVQSDNKVILGGVNRCQRLNSNGTIDTSFSCTPGTSNSDTPRIRGIGLQTDGKVVVTGDFLRINNVLAPGIARLRSVSGIAFDFDGDGKADPSVFRPSTNVWYRLVNGNTQVLQTTFAITGDIPVPADYDGDGKTDLAIFRPSSGDWWYQSSINGAQIQNHWGQIGDIPRPSDFDGDGKADFVLFRPSELNWYRFGSTGQVSTKGFGSVGDKPVIGDFDGDGKSDVAIFRPSTGDWWYQSSINNAQLAARWGIATDTPSPADYDGDGKTDFAVYRASTGVWYILNSSNGSATIIPFGIAEDKPVPADYDGDGKADIAVYRPSSGIWYMLRSTAGFTGLQFGISSDIPTPNSFIP